MIRVSLSKGSSLRKGLPSSYPMSTYMYMYMYTYTYMYKYMYMFMYSYTYTYMYMGRADPGDGHPAQEFDNRYFLMP